METFEKAITKDLVDACQQNQPWHLANETLYKLCKENFDHNTDEKIIAKH